LVRKLDHYLSGLGDRLGSLPWLDPGHLLLLGGGYGRGEGGIFKKTDGAPELYNDLEFYLIVPAHLQKPARHWCAEESHRGEEETGIEVEFKVMSRAAWRRSKPGMFVYDLAVGHVVVSGDRAILDELPPGAGDASQIPLHEATRLLFNRGSSLYFSGHALRFQTERSKGAYVERVQSKLKLALADAVLAAHGGYDRSCLVRRDRALGLTGDLPPGWPAILALHAEGVEFKLHPRHAGGDMAESQESLRRVWADVWLWLERRRLGVVWGQLSDYALWRGDLLPGESVLRCMLLRLRDRLKYRECLPAWNEPPRACLMRALAALHGGREDLAAAALGVPTDPQLLHDAYRRWWLRYN